MIKRHFAPALSQYNSNHRHSLPHGLDWSFSIFALSFSLHNFYLFFSKWSIGSSLINYAYWIQITAQVLLLYVYKHLQLVLWCSAFSLETHLIRFVLKRAFLFIKPSLGKQIVCELRQISQHQFMCKMPILKHSMTLMILQEITSFAFNQFYRFHIWLAPGAVQHLLKTAIIPTSHEQNYRILTLNFTLWHKKCIAL